jgi:hypothetical protein
MKTLISARVSDATKAKLDFLSNVHGTQSEAIAVAIDRLFVAEKGAQMMSADKFLEMFSDCPWMVTAFDYAAACNTALLSGDSTGLEKLSAFGRKHGPFPEELPSPVQK